MRPGLLKEMSMPRIDPQEFEQRAQRVRKAADGLIEAESSLRAAKEGLRAAQDEHQNAERHLAEYVQESVGAKPLPF